MSKRKAEEQSEQKGKRVKPDHACDHCESQMQKKALLERFCDKKCMAAYIATRTTTPCSRCNNPAAASQFYDGKEFCGDECNRAHHDICPVCSGETRGRGRRGFASMRWCTKGHNWRKCGTHNRKTLALDDNCDCVANGAEPTNEELYDYQALKLKQANPDTWQSILLDSLFAHLGLSRQQATEQLRSWLTQSV
jgi:hypothetical protein